MNGAAGLGTATATAGGTEGSAALQDAGSRRAKSRSAWFRVVWIDEDAETEAHAKLAGAYIRRELIGRGAGECDAHDCLLRITPWTPTLERAEERADDEEPLPAHGLIS